MPLEAIHAAIVGLVLVLMVASCEKPRSLMGSFELGHSVIRAADVSCYSTSR